MTEQTVFSSLFLDDVIESSNKIICLKNKLYKSIPSLLFKNSISKMYNETKIFFNDAKGLILFYSMRESRSKKTRTEVLNKCIELKNNYPTHAIMIGYLIGTDTVNENQIILQNMVFKIVVGETFLRFLLPCDSIYDEYKRRLTNILVYKMN